MTDEELKLYAGVLMVDYAYDVEGLTIFEAAETYLPSGEISDDDARKVRELIRHARVTVEFDGDYEDDE